MRVYNAIVLLDEPGGRHFATWVEKQIKTIETRMRDIIPAGDIVICCSAGSMTANRTKALCIVNAAEGRTMTDADETAACIETAPGRVAYDLSEWRYFSINSRSQSTWLAAPIRAFFKSGYQITLK